MPRTPPVFHPDEAAPLRSVLEDVGPSLSVVSGPRGIGKTHLVQELVSGDPAAVYYRALPLPDAAHRALVSQSLEGWAGRELEVSGPDWADLLGAVASVVARTRRRLVLVLDDVHRLVETRGRLGALLADGWTEIRARSLPVHLVLAGRSPDAETSLLDEDGPLRPLVGLHLTVQPLDFRGVARRVPAWPPAERLMAWGVFGGRPSRVRHLNPRADLAANVRRLMLDPDGALFLEGLAELEEGASSVARYAAILRSMAGGAREWGAIRAATSGVELGGQMAPYLARLEGLGLVAAERSLDAGPRTRRRRYRVTDPFLSFWYHLVLPHVSGIQSGRGAEVWGRRVRPGLVEHMRRIFPSLARVYLARYAGERFPAAAREVGGLWGQGYDLDPAGTLRTGPVVYGTTCWTDTPVAGSVDEGLASQIRATRYGFGREARLRLLFSKAAFAPGLVRRAARDPLLHLLGPEDLLGEPRGSGRALPRNPPTGLE